MRTLLKGLGLVPLLIAYIVSSCAIVVLPAGARVRRRFLIGNTSMFSRIALALLRIRVRVKHRERLYAGAAGRLVAANHVSYIDILVISSLMPSVFVTSVELGSTMFLGMLARLGGSLFVERRKASGLKAEIEEIGRVLGEGFAVALFPEGTTSNGDRVRPFKKSLFDAAVMTGSDVLPLCIRYSRVNGVGLTPNNRDLVFYYGGISFSQHIPRLLSLKSVNVEVIPLRAIRAHKKNTRKELAAEAHDAISAAYHV
jgi:1-acyl-sn-glycerol-3-phosphate acyltransferase